MQVLKENMDTMEIKWMIEKGANETSVVQKCICELNDSLAEHNSRLDIIEENMLDIENLAVEAVEAKHTHNAT